LKITSIAPPGGVFSTVNVTAGFADRIDFLLATKTR